ncbi:myo-inositol-1(or 4)-monophosphatase [Natronoarchaeum philippinense]|uniref:fructose-bisphosphatase n=1 Tax=Natronoarchaeum philippinense TaxID=558529 RepID=A0A285N7L4_NATPI|nr:inositol monophosphatase [Natronoarchaeum philippinense]SNZ05472.1 myo-inositol-1(or 4)-monophosphatase [Natronoarchaeum philippinense]
MAFDDPAGTAERAARSGGETAAETFRGRLDIETKDHAADLVTQADRAAQQTVVSTLRDATPDVPIVAEEDDARKTVPEDGPAWIVDPIDGTANYVRGIQFWATSVAAIEDGEPVAAANALPALDDVYVADTSTARMNGEEVAVSERSNPAAFAVAATMWWGFMGEGRYGDTLARLGERFGDLRRLGAAQPTLSLVASGALDAAATPISPNPWDAVAGVRLIRSAGGVVTDVHGNRWTVDSEGLIASNGAAHQQLVDAVAPSES